jgi:hypothetical protein
VRTVAFEQDGGGAGRLATRGLGEAKGRGLTAAIGYQFPVSRDDGIIGQVLAGEA